MDILNVVNDTQQAVVESANEGAVTGAAVSGTPDTMENAEVTVRKQSPKENSGYRKMRLENEGYKKEIERLNRRLESLSGADSVKAQRDRYLEEIVKQSMSADLDRIRRIDPEVESLVSLGDDFVRLVECGIDVEIAYRAVKGESKPKPPTLSKVGASEGANPRYFTSTQLDRLTAKDLENPAVYKKALESLKQL